MPAMVPSTLFYLFFIVFFPLSFTPLYPLLVAIATLLSMSMSPSSFLLDPSTPSSPRTRAVSLLSIYESVSILRASSVCSLDSTSEII